VVATSRSRDPGNISYAQGESGSDAFDARFDAVGSLEGLMAQSDPAASLAGVAAHSRAGGSCLSTRSAPTRSPRALPCPASIKYLPGTPRSPAVWRQPELRLFPVRRLSHRGLPAPTILTDAIHGQEAGAANVLMQVRNLASSLAEMEDVAVATRDRVGIDMRLDRMLDATTTAQSVVVGRLQFGVYCTV
jgi:hypothetical protein